MFLRSLFVLSLFTLALFLGCSSDQRKQNFSYLRSPADFKADTAKTDSDICTDFGEAFTSEAECRQGKKFRLTWERPEDTTRLRGYRIYVDTLYPNAPKGAKWAQVQADPKRASIIVERSPLADEITFVFRAIDSKDASKQDTLKQGTKKIFVIDTTGRQDPATGQLIFALVPVYSGDVTPGQPKLTWFIVSDKLPPEVFSPTVRVQAREIQIQWARPKDQAGLFHTTADTGLIRNYGLEITLGGALTKARKEAFAPKLQFYLGDQDISGQVKATPLPEPGKEIPFGLRYYLPDSNHAQKSLATLKDSLKVTIQQLLPQDTLNILLWAVDSLGNQNKEAMQSLVVHLTDTTEPTQPIFTFDSTQISANRFIIKWSASKDTTADMPNFGIAEYLLTRTMLRDSGEKVSALDRIETRIFIKEESTKTFIDTMRFLPPGRKFQLRIKAIDRTGYESKSDSLMLATQPVRFNDSDSTLVCPKGFIPMPRANFTLGQPPNNSASDEPIHNVKMEPFCIEPYEHRDSTGRFMSNLTWAEADSICRNLPIDTAAHKPMLCSEAEWERACEGPGTGLDSALLHGILSEQKNPSILQSSCNQGTQDSLMAKSFDLRNAMCLTGEGVYDMAGNYSEWVRDPYSEKAYTTLPTSKILNHDFSFANLAPTKDSVRIPGFRGGNFLKPSTLPTSTIQSLARCSNRDFAQQVRPVFRSECVDPMAEKIAVIYGPGITGHFCMTLPDSIQREGEIINLQPRDSTLVVSYAGKTLTKTVAIDYPTGDTTSRRKRPISSVLTKRSLAVIEFVKPGTEKSIPDTLDANELKDTSQVSLSKIFAREAGNSGWTVKKTDGKFEIKYLYAHTYIGTKPAKPNYTSRAIGFRCCSLPKPR